jgi:hypothetical protein
MKNVLFYLLFMAGASFLFVCCKKTNIADNDPNIYDRLIDSVSVSPGPGKTPYNIAIDLDEDGFADLFMAASEDSLGVAKTAIAGSPGLSGVLTDGNQIAAPSDENELIDSVSVPRPAWPRSVWSDYGIASLVGPNVNTGEANATDFYLGIFTTKLDGVHYGWLRLNVAQDGKSIRLKELAYHGRPRTAIRVGER